jgi:hypothetical protein
VSSSQRRGVIDTIAHQACNRGSRPPSSRGSVR